MNQQVFFFRAILFSRVILFFKAILVWICLISIPMLFLNGNALAQKTSQGTQKSLDKLSLAEGICVARAQSQYQAGDVRKAIDLLETFSKKSEKSHYYIYFLLGNYYISLDQPHKAIACYQASVNLNPGFSAGWLNLAKIWYESSSFAKAARAFEHGYASCPTPDSIHLYDAAICYFQADVPKKALAVFERLIQSHPDKISLAWEETLVNILFALERYTQALPILENLAVNTRDEKQKKWQEILLSQYIHLNMKKKALAYANCLTRTDPLEPKWWKALCQIHLNDNRYKKGLSALILYGYLAPMTPGESMLAGDLYASLGIPAQAIYFYQAALEGGQESTPDQRLKTILKICQACSQAHEPDKALEWIEQGLTDCKDTRLLRMKAQILYQQKQYDRAADAYDCLVKSLLTQDKSNGKGLGQAWLMLGYAVLNQNSADPDQPDPARIYRAQNAFSKAAAFKAHQKSARAALGQIKTLQTHILK